mmetsp:Transcript_54734/g.127732  ORF Transcript_54734/g.127732 Transcript_54734/m.127732 type:complete len:220 (+) Transcript_54734:1159-1818(+)
MAPWKQGPNQAEAGTWAKCLHPWWKSAKAQLFAAPGGPQSSQEGPERGIPEAALSRALKAEIRDNRQRLPAHRLWRSCLWTSSSAGFPLVGRGGSVGIRHRSGNPSASRTTRKAYIPPCRGGLILWRSSAADRLRPPFPNRPSAAWLGCWMARSVTNRLAWRPVWPSSSISLRRLGKGDSNHIHGPVNSLEASSTTHKDCTHPHHGALSLAFQRLLREM